LPGPLCVGLGAACEFAEQDMASDNERLRRLRDRFLKGLSDIPELYINGDLEQRFPGNLNISFAYIEGESMLMALKDLAVSSGSACTSASLEPSYVLRALGVDVEMAHTSIRIGIGRFTTEDEIDYAVKTIHEHVDRLREMSPLWEMVQDGIDLKSIEWTDH
jgi:cysteine desulfurase